ncbi:MAG: hypothetical protein J1G01_05405 [Clostridiales bacterium]|nr:hypothetical protein [Clostridiales bacterium]
MTEKRKSSSIFIIVFLLAALSALLILLGGGSAIYRAEVDKKQVALSPIEVENTDIVYHCFEDPTSLYADSIGILVAGLSGIETVSSESEITSRLSQSADKVYRHIEHGEHAEYLIVLDGGKLMTVTGSGTETVDTELEFIDFAVYNDSLYAISPSSLTVFPLGENALDGSAASTVEFTSDRYTNIKATAISVLNGNIYVAVNSAFGHKQDICVSSSHGALNAVLMQSDAVLSLTSDGATLFTLTRDELISYTVSSGGGLVKTHSSRGSQLTSIYAYNGFVYALDSLNALHKISADLSMDKTLLASSSFAKGFFNMPTGAAVKNSKLYVADSMNGRVAIYGSIVEYIPKSFTNPVSVASDSAGNVYVAYEYGKVGIFEGGDFSSQNERIVTADFGFIKQIAVDYDKKLYILSDTGLWTANNGASPVCIDETKYKAITLGIGREKLYALGDGNVVTFDKKNNSSVYCTANSDAFSLAVDLNGNVFMLSQTSITVYDGSDYATYDLYSDKEQYTLGSTSGQILLSTVENEYVGYGDVIIVDTYRHRLFNADGQAVGVTLINEDYQVPEVGQNPVPDKHHDGLIRTALRDTDVFSLPMETRAMYTIAAGRKVIVPQYDLEETREYALVLIDDTVNGKLVQGYVYKDMLSEPLAYSPPPAEVGSIFNSATPIYKWPSHNSAKIFGYAAVDRNTEFGMLDFVESYRDDYGDLWYRLALENGYEGYILAINISTTDYEPIFIRPAYDAKIISYKGSKFAPAYIIENGSYVKIAELPTGTQVEVIGAFDSSKRYTKVKYLDPELGTLTCYVETVYIDYEGVNIVPIVAVIVIVITVILASLIIWRMSQNKKKRIEHNDND